MHANRRPDIAEAQLTVCFIAVPDGVKVESYGREHQREKRTQSVNRNHQYYPDCVTLNPGFRVIRQVTVDVVSCDELSCQGEESRWYLSACTFQEVKTRHINETEKK